MIANDNNTSNDNRPVPKRLRELIDLAVKVKAELDSFANGFNTIDEICENIGNATKKNCEVL